MGCFLSYLAYVYFTQPMIMTNLPEQTSLFCLLHVLHFDSNSWLSAFRIISRVAQHTSSMLPTHSSTRTGWSVPRLSCFTIFVGLDPGCRPLFLNEGRCNHHSRGLTGLRSSNIQ